MLYYNYAMQAELPNYLLLVPIIFDTISFFPDQWILLLMNLPQYQLTTRVIHFS